MKHLPILGLLLWTFLPRLEAGEFRVGSGINFSSARLEGVIRDSLLGNLTLKPGFNVTGFYRHPLTQTLSLEGGLGYEMRGFSSRNALTYSITSPIQAEAKVEGTGKWTLYYLRCPLMLGYSPWPGLTFKGGPELGFFLSGRGEGHYKISQSAPSLGFHSTTESDTLIDVDSSYFSTADLGLGLGADYTIGEAVFISAGFYWGLNNANAAEAYAGSLRHYLIQLTAGYLFKL